MTEGTDLVIEVVNALAQADRVDPEELEYSLYEYINPDILSELSSLEQDSWEFTFEVADHEVTITGDGRLFVDGVLCKDEIPPA